MWDDRYSEPGYAYGTVANDFLVSVASQIPPGRVLSLGEGEGRNSVYLATRGNEVVGVDASAVGLAKARQLAADRQVQVETVHADLASYELGSSCWSAIVSIFCHLPADQRAALHKRVATALAPGGVFVLEAYTPRQLEFRTGGPPVVDLLVTEADLRAELTGLELLIARERERDVVEGSLHTGRAHVVQVLARKTGSA